MRISAIAAAILATAVTATSIEKRSGCTATSYSEIAGTKSCSSIVIQGPFTVPANQMIDLTGLKTGCAVKIVGTITFAKGNLDVNNFLVTIGGTNINVDATKGIFNGNGPLYWDGKGGNGGVNKPRFLRLFKMSGSLTGLTILNGPVMTVSILGCNGLTVSGVTIDNRGPKYALGHNTDGFGISSSNDVTITGAKVYNSDDCLALNSGTNIKFTNNYCWGGHGISIGSIKAGAIVDGVTVSGSTVVNSANAIRIKAYPNATGGKVNNVTYSDITLSSIQNYGVVIEQDYTNAGPTGKPGAAAPITNVNLNNIHGTMAKKGLSVYVLCA
ncbi:polygalacturonase, partial [Dissophora ornata]